MLQGTLSLLSIQIEFSSHHNLRVRAPSPSTGSTVSWASAQDSLFTHAVFFHITWAERRSV